ncbi:hypothetical protein PanWU01x14_023430, partial [Parasponia andersonii]
GSAVHGDVVGEGQEYEGGFLEERLLADVLVHGPPRGHGGVGLELDALGSGLLVEPERVVDGQAGAVLGRDLALLLVVDEDRVGPAYQLDEAQGRDGEWGG